MPAVFPRNSLNSKHSLSVNTVIIVTFTTGARVIAHIFISVQSSGLWPGQVSYGVVYVPVGNKQVMGNIQLLLLLLLLSAITRCCWITSVKLHALLPAVNCQFPYSDRALSQANFRETIPTMAEDLTYLCVRLLLGGNSVIVCLRGHTDRLIDWLTFSTLD